MVEALERVERSVGSEIIEVAILSGLTSQCDPGENMLKTLSYQPTRDRIERPVIKQHALKPRNQRLGRKP